MDNVSDQVFKTGTLGKYPEGIVGLNLTDSLPVGDPQWARTIEPIRLYKPE